MHGFPDDSRIYDRLVPLLSTRRILVFDWLGYGRSDRADPGARGVGHQHELRAVLDSLQLGRVVLVGHDASGPEAIDFAVTEPGRVGQLVLLNTYYGHAPSLRLPEMIRLLADPGLTPLSDAMIAEPGQRLWLLAHTGSQFGMTSQTRAESPCARLNSADWRTSPTPSKIATRGRRGVGAALRRSAPAGWPRSRSPVPAGRDPR
jgi:pimeloyl-ACP methyl ester carboxylesterase